MEDLYSIHPGISRGGGAASEASGVAGGASSPPPPPPPADLTELMKAQIAGHPRYPSLLSAYIECRKVGEPPEVATLLEEIGRDRCGGASGAEIGLDPELDEFMEAYCRVLVRYKEELSQPFEEAASFLSSIQTQLTSLCGGASASTSHSGQIVSMQMGCRRVRGRGRKSKALGVCSCRVLSKVVCSLSLSLSLSRGQRLREVAATCRLCSVDPVMELESIAAWMALEKGESCSCMLVTSAQW